MTPEEYRDTGWAVSAPSSIAIMEADKHDGDPGVEVYRHPELELALRPHLVPMVDEVRCGLWRTPSREQWLTLSNYETETVLLYQNALIRSESARAKEKTDG